MTTRTLIVSGAIFMALAVAFGAFGAHLVQDMLTSDRFRVYQTGVEYHFYHALGLLLLGAITLAIPENRWLRWCGYSFVAGILIFSGSLYLLTLTDTGWLGAITPIGGVAFILGWIFLAVGVISGKFKSA